MNRTKSASVGNAGSAVVLSWRRWRVKKVTDRKDIDEENDDVETELGRVESRNGAVYTVIVHRNMSDKVR